MRGDYRARQIAMALDRSIKCIQRRAVAEAWSFRTATTRGGTVRLYAFEALPSDIQLAMLKARRSALHDEVTTLAALAKALAADIDQLLRRTGKARS